MDSPDDIKRALKRLRIPHDEIALAIGKDRTVATKIFGSANRRIQAAEIAPLKQLIARYEATARQPSEAPTDTDVRDDLPGVVMLPEYDVRLSAGDGFYVDAETTRRVWPYPRFLIVDQLGVTPSRATVQEVIGDSMEPTLSSGDYVVIDMADTRIGLPGIFAVWDGDALVCKRVERVPGTTPRKVMLRSDNPLHGAYEVEEEDVRIIGRVRWITRRA